MKTEGDQVELVVGQAKLLAVIVPARLYDERFHAVEALCDGAGLKLQMGLCLRWQVWAVFCAEDWEAPAERPKGTLKLAFLNA